jgi:ABC-type Fe3+-citrate transport system substrate-binding protein
LGKNMQIVLKMGVVSVILVLLSACSSKAERQFMAGCKSGGTDSSQCSCVYDKLENHYGKKTMERLAYIDYSMADARQTTPSDFPEQLVQAAYQCGAEVN